MTNCVERTSLCTRSLFFRLRKESLIVFVEPSATCSSIFFVIVSSLANSLRMRRLCAAGFPLSLQPLRCMNRRRRHSWDLSTRVACCSRGLQAELRPVFRKLQSPRGCAPLPEFCTTRLALRNKNQICVSELEMRRSVEYTEATRQHRSFTQSSKQLSTI